MLNTLQDRSWVFILHWFDLWGYRNSSSPAGGLGKLPPCWPKPLDRTAGESGPSMWGATSMPGNCPLQLLAASEVAKDRTSPRLGQPRPQSPLHSQDLPSHVGDPLLFNILVPWWFV